MSLELKGPIEYGLDPKFTGYLPGQEEAILSIRDQFRSGKSVVFVDGPVGCGKSLVAVALSKLMEDSYPGFSTLYTVQTKALQNQISRDFPFYKDMRGRGNFQCAEQPDLSVSEGLCSLPDYKCEDKFQICPYYQHKAAAARATSVVTNACVTGDTIVPTNLPGSGKVHFKRIDELVAEQPAGAKVYAFNPDTLRCEQVDIEQYWNHKAQDVYRIKTYNGKTIRVSAGHNFFVPGKGKPISKPAHDLEPGDKIATGFRLHHQFTRRTERLDCLRILCSLAPEETRISGPEARDLVRNHRLAFYQAFEDSGLGREAISKKLYEIEKKGQGLRCNILLKALGCASYYILDDLLITCGGNAAQPISRYIEISDEFLWILGFWVAEGWYTSNGVAWAVGEDLQDRFCRLVETCFPGIHCYMNTIKDAKADQFTLMSVTLKHVMKALGFLGLAQYKNVPSFILGLNPKQLLAFFKGYLAGDGNKARSGARRWEGCATVSERLREDIEKVLLILGWPHRVRLERRSEKRPKWHDIWWIGFYSHNRNYAKGMAKYATGDIWWDEVVSVEPTGEQEPMYDLGTKHRNFLANSIFVHNSFFLHEVNYTDGLVCGGRNLLVLDEGHLLENSIMGFVSVLLPERSLKAVGVDLPSLSAPEDAKRWAGQIYPVVSREYTEISARVSAATRANGNVDVYDIRQLLRYKAMTKRLSTLRDIEPGKWFLAKTYAGYTLKPFLVDEFVQPLVTSHSPKVLMMSATFLSSTVMTRLLGLDIKTTGWHQMDSNFPKERRPYNFIPVMKLNYKTGSVGYQRLTEVIDEILEKHPDEKGVVHTSSFKIMNQILRFTRYPQRFLSHKPSASLERSELTRDEAIGEFMRTSRPRVLISPSVGLGLDLRDDLARFQIIAKVPFLSLGDPQVKYRLSVDQEWYSWSAVAAVVQSCGRSTRHAGDYSTCYVLDSALWQLWKKRKYLFPRWWRDALHIIRSKSVSDAVIAKR